MARADEDLENGMGARVLLLEQQALQNHASVGRLAMVIEGLKTNLDWEQQRSAMLEGRMDEYQKMSFDMNLKFQNVKTVINMRTAEHAEYSAKFLQIEASMVHLQSTVAHAGTVLEQDVAGLHQAKPQEGAVLTAAFQQQSQEITAVRDAVRAASSLPSVAVGIPMPMGVAFTEEMRACMEKVINEMGNLQAIGHGMTSVNGRLHELETAVTFQLSR